jgi:hypothetical protein
MPKEQLLKVCKDIFGKDRLQAAVRELTQWPGTTAQRAGSGAAPGASSQGVGAAPQFNLTALPPAGVPRVVALPPAATTSLGVPPLQGLGALALVPVLAPVPIQSDASRKRPLPAQGGSQPPAENPDAAKRARVERPAALADGYSMAAAAADDAAGADKQADADGAHEPVAISRGFDIFQVAGVDMFQEEEALAASGFTAPGESAVAEEPWADRISTSGMRDRLRAVCQQCGMDGADEGATRLLAEGLGERLSGLLGNLRHLANHRTGAHKELFGPGAFRVTFDPKVPWRKRVADEARAAVQPVPPLPPRPAVRAPRPAQLADDERRMAQMAGLGPAAGGAGPGLPVSVTAADVLFQLEQEPQSGRSRVLQWWRCEGRPLRRYARRSARLYIAQVRQWGRHAAPPRMPRPPPLSCRLPCALDEPSHACADSPPPRASLTAATRPQRRGRGRDRPLAGAIGGAGRSAANRRRPGVRGSLVRLFQFIFFFLKKWARSGPLQAATGAACMLRRAC